MSSVTIVGTLVNPVTLEPFRGSLSIKASAFARNTLTDVVYGNVSTTVVPDVEDGTFTFDVAAVDETGIDPSNFAYECIVRGVNEGRITSFLFQVFESDAPGPVNFADLVPAQVAIEFASYVTSAELSTGLAGKQAADADLTSLAGLDSSTSGAIASDGAGWIKKTYSQFKTALGLVKADVGLGSVDNTSDASKPISTATQTALDGKVGFPAVADATVFVSARGNDSNDGLTLKTAKLTLTGAVAALSGPGRIQLAGGTIASGGNVDLSSRTGVIIEGMNGVSGGAVPGSIISHSGTGSTPIINLAHSVGCKLKGFMLLYSSASFTGPAVNVGTTSGLATTLWAIEDLYIGGSGSGLLAGVGINLSGSQDGVIRDCNIVGNSVGIQGRAASGDQVNVITILNNRFGGNGTSHIHNIGEGWAILGNNFEQLSGGGAGAIVNDSGVNVRGVSITGNWFGDVTAGVGGTQIALGGSGFSIHGNMIGVNTTAKCIDIAASSSGFRINGNYLTGGGTGDTGIALGATCSSYDCSSNTYVNLATKFSGGPEVSWLPSAASSSTYVWNNTVGGVQLAFNTSNGRVGVLTSNPTSGLHVAGSIGYLYTAVTGATTLGSHLIVGASAAAPYSLTLPTAVGVQGRVYRIIKTDNNANLITIATTSSQTINGATTYTALTYQYAFIEVISDGANWIIINKSVRPADIQTFTCSPANTNTVGTWNKPDGAVSVSVMLISGGGGGGSGRRGAAGSLRTGGGGGGGGGVSMATFPASTLPSSVNVNIGAGGTGGAAVTTDGNAGVNGSLSRFGTSGSSSTSFLVANTGANTRGTGGTGVGGASGGVGAFGNLGNGNGGGGSNAGGGTGSDGSAATSGAPGAAGGGGISTGDTPAAGGTGGFNITTTYAGGGLGGGANGAAGGAGQSVPAGMARPGGAGGGGGAGTTQAAAAGGDGGLYGAGGAGGGASLNGFNSGAGGNGGDGIVVVTTTF